MSGVTPYTLSGAGLSVIPANGKKPVRSWKEYQKEHPNHGSAQNLGQR